MATVINPLLSPFFILAHCLGEALRNGGALVLHLRVFAAFLIEGDRPEIGPRQDEVNGYSRNRRGKETLRHPKGPREKQKLELGKGSKPETTSYQG